MSLPAKDLYLAMKLVLRRINANRNGRKIQQNGPDDQDAHHHHRVNLEVLQHLINYNVLHIGITAERTICLKQK